MADSQRKTANLFDKDSIELVQITAQGDLREGTVIGVLPQNTYTISGNKSVDATRLYITKITNGTYSTNEITGFPYSFQADGTSTYELRTANQTVLTWESRGYTNVMVNEGSTPLPYEPYGWVHSLRKLTTSTDTLTTLPSDLYADGNTATVGLVGNMSQTGTPSPSSIIMPSECGERTNNLFDYQTGTPTAYKYLDENGNEVVVTELAPWYITDYIPIPDGILSVTLSKIGGGSPAMCAYDASKNYITGIKYNTGSAVTKVDITLTSSTPIRFIRFSYFLGNTGYDDISTKMLNSGSTPLPYEPYGYKIPILSANTTTPVYLGEVQSERKIKKYVCTGEEVWAASNGVWYISTIDDYAKNTDYRCICSHYPTQDNVGGTADVTEGHVCFGTGTLNRLFIKDVNYTSSSTWKQYLADQYAAGTPVTVWYVLATPETGIVNEPLRKIGDYADTVSGITIPTITGKDSFDVQTTLKPSEVSLNYTGWHDASVKEWDGSEWQ